MNKAGDLTKAKKAFLKDLKNDKDFQEFKKKTFSKQISFGVITISEDIYCKDKQFSKIVKKYLKKLK